MELRQTQQLNLSLFAKPEMRQAFLILTLPLDQLSSYLLEVIDHNPLFTFLEETGGSLTEEKVGDLEFTEDNFYYTNHFDLIDRIEDGEVPEEAGDAGDLVVFKESSYEELMKEFKEYTQDPKLIGEAEQIIGNLDSHGLLKEKVPLSKALSIIHEMGYGFKTLREMFLHQLKSQQDSRAYDLIQNHWDDLVKGHVKKEYLKLLKDNLICPLLTNHVEGAAAPICDIIIDEDYNVVVNEEGLPKFGLEGRFFNDPGMKRARGEALWVLKNLKARSDFLGALGKELVKTNLPYLKGEKPLKTLKVKSCAQELSIHPSTLYRAIKSKWIATPQGVMPLKRFFAEKASVEEKIEELVKGEKHPLTDDELLGLLLKEGYRLSRRAIAKYRQLLGIPSSRQRK